MLSKQGQKDWIPRSRDACYLYPLTQAASFIAVLRSFFYLLACLIINVGLALIDVGFLFFNYS